MIIEYDKNIFSPEEIQNYINICRVKHPNATSLSFRLEGDKVAVDYCERGRPFERIRRITGYLTGDLNSWNNAKQAEESERVKHSCELKIEN